MATACVMLYNALYYPPMTADPFSVVTLMFWFAGSMFNLGVVAVGAAYVNHVVSTVVTFL